MPKIIRSTPAKAAYVLEKVQEDRQKKLQAIRELGIDPYGGRYDTAEPIAEIVARYERWEAEQGGPEAAQEAEGGPRGDAAGRIVLMRKMGKLIFAHLRDQTGQMQIALRKNAFDETTWALGKELLDLGDLVAVEGPVRRTKTGEVTIWAERLVLLCKSLNPMPEKFHGLTDTEARYRQRYLDLMTNPESMRRFRQRSEIIAHFRRVLADRGFDEVETPALQPIYGGGAALPFTTHYNALDADFYLRISPELYLKRLLVGGMEKVYEFARVFRNEGIDSTHSPEYTLFELYQAGADYHVMMDITEELIATAAAIIRPADEVRQLLGQLMDWAALAKQYETMLRAAPQGFWDATSLQLCRKPFEDIVSQTAGLDSAVRAALHAVQLRTQERLALPYADQTIDYTPPWPQEKYADLLAKHADVDMRDAAAVRAKARELGIEESNKDDAVVVNEVFEETVEPALAESDRPVFVMDYPAALCPLTRRKADDPEIAERFELYIAGMEIANAYTELNDPAVQEANLRGQLRGEAEGETMRVMDKDFITALRHGMPPAGGLGIGIDRVVMLLTNTPSIRDAVLFPTLRPGDR